MRHLSTEVEAVIEEARDFCRGRIFPETDDVLASRFASALVQVADACVIGLPCEKHYGSVHGKEAEELRKGIEEIFREGRQGDNDDWTWRDMLRELLDRVDARDSLAFLEATDASSQEATP